MGAASGTPKDWRTCTGVYAAAAPILNVSSSLEREIDRISRDAKRHRDGSLRHTRVRRVARRGLGRIGARRRLVPRRHGDGDDKTCGMKRGSNQSHEG